MGQLVCNYEEGKKTHLYIFNLVTKQKKNEWV